MSDIVDRLRSDRGAGNDHWQDVWEAAAEIERLRAALAAKTEECAAIRALPPPVQDTIKKEGK